MKRLNQSGSHIVAGAVAVLVLGVVAFAGYTVSQRGGNKTVQTATPAAAKPAAASTISSNADLSKAASQLDNSSSQVDSNLNDSSLDADLNDML